MRESYQNRLAPKKHMIGARTDPYESCRTSPGNGARTSLGRANSRGSSCELRIMDGLVRDDKNTQRAVLTKTRSKPSFEKAATRMREWAAGNYHCLHRRPAGSEVTGALGRLRWKERGTKLRGKIRHDRRGRSLHRRYRNRPRRLFDRLRPSPLRSYRRISWRLRLSRLLSHC